MMVFGQVRKKEKENRLYLITLKIVDDCGPDSRPLLLN
jgi:hypothetical protein